MKFFILIVGLFPFFVFSALAPLKKQKIIGKVVQYDKKTVEVSVKNRNGVRNITVPRGSILTNFKFQTGDCVSASVKPNSLKKEEK